nr:dethiobiotin synthase [uncultured Acetatifactor sp.]
MSRKLFIVGTGTDVGKTYVTGLILKKLKESGRRAGYYKAAMSGNERRSDGILIPGDALHVKNVSGIDQPLEQMCPYIYENAVSPHLASRLEGNPVRLDVVEKGFREVCAAYDYVTMEGSGGILCPVCFDEEEIWLEDVITRLNLSCLLIADAGLGTINNVVLTAEYMRSQGILIKGIIFNRFHADNVMEEDNVRVCEHRTGLKVLACVEEGAADLAMEGELLASLYET